jgi:hypothetical protein
MRAYHILITSETQLDGAHWCTHTDLLALVTVVEDVRLRNGTSDEWRGKRVPNPSMQMRTQKMESRR